MTDVVTWAESMVEPLRARAAEAERLRQLPDETIDEAAAAGFFRALMPTELGGPESGSMPSPTPPARSLAGACRRRGRSRSSRCTTG